MTLDFLASETASNNKNTRLQISFLDIIKIDIYVGTYLLTFKYNVDLSIILPSKNKIQCCNKYSIVKNVQTYMDCISQF